MLRTCTLSPHLVSTPCPHTLSPHIVSTPCLFTLRLNTLFLRFVESDRITGGLIFVFVLVLDPGTTATTGTTGARRGKRLLARGYEDEQTLVPPVAAGSASFAVPCVRLAGTASPHLCWHASAETAPNAAHDWRTLPPGTAGSSVPAFPFTFAAACTEPPRPPRRRRLTVRQPKCRARRLSYVALAKYGSRHAAMRCDRRAAAMM